MLSTVLRPDFTSIGTGLPINTTDSNDDILLQI